MAPKPRSLIMDLFGDYLRYAGGEVRLGTLTRLLTAFDIEPSSSRVTLSRLKKEGWFTTRREGRETVYTLSDEMMRVLVEGRERIFHRTDEPWGGRWTMVLYQVPESERATRESLRKSLAWLGFGQLSASIWMAAHELMPEARQLAEKHSEATIDVMWSGTGSISADRAMAARCWDLESLMEDYRGFIAKYRPMDDPVRNLDRDGEEAMVLRTLLVGDARRFTFRDPRLPIELQPEGWPGREAYELFRRVHAQLAPRANTHVESVIGTQLSTFPSLAA
ncbi:PaaX family transcriptional regulator C-terminal domain-containing protein [Arthrobacter sp. VKM Ac-2550]|uniref:PaaX family transcriptional regulator n=1 Tax=Crystallibacter permensis TaxID=1938888 RepID=UPI0022261815|nr:PaaX family transcriptional regulator C-terminal domain-containing protein [Arthrobacter sp. VKM Ac-2550]MCW2135245.1 transcriptional regulator, PaaX family [Arthrobacter sp. VKM Ac-2550]